VPTFEAKRPCAAPGKTLGRQKFRAVRRIFHARQLTGEVSALMTTDSGICYREPVWGSYEGRTSNTACNGRKSKRLCIPPYRSGNFNHPLTPLDCSHEQCSAPCVANADPDNLRAAGLAQGANGKIFVLGEDDCCGVACPRPGFGVCCAVPAKIEYVLGIMAVRNQLACQCRR